MKELVVISGKGGTGKTSVVASFAALAGKTVLADCDVDAADLHLVVEPTVLRQEAVIDIALTGTFGELVALVYGDPLCCRLQPGQCRALMRELLEAIRACITNPKLLDFGR